MYIIVLLGLLVGILEVNLSAGCRCVNQHPQYVFCDADFVLKGKVVSYYTTDSHKIYRVKVQRVYKRPFNAKRSKYISVQTHLSTASCELGMNVKETWLLLGSYNSKRYHVNSCGWNRLFKDVTSYQLKYLKGEYGRNCNDCKLQYCRYPDLPCSSVPPDACIWPIYDCQNDVCIRSNEGCGWKSMVRHLQAVSSRPKLCSIYPTCENIQKDRNLFKRSKNILALDKLFNR